VYYVIESIQIYYQFKDLYLV